MVERNKLLINLYIIILLIVINLISFSIIFAKYKKSYKDYNCLIDQIHENNSNNSISFLNYNYNKNDIYSQKVSNEIIILFGSKSEIKTTAIHKSFYKIFKQSKLKLILYEVSSEINVQPIGQEETIQGAINRLENTKTLHQKGNNSFIDYDYTIGIESGLIKLQNKWLTNKNIKNDFQWYDSAFIAIEHKPTGIKLIEQSASLEFPYEAVKNAEIKGFNKSTAADFIKDIYKHNNEDNTIDTKDPHKFLLNNISNRMEIITNALELAFARIIVKINMNNLNEYN